MLSGCVFSDKYIGVGLSSAPWILKIWGIDVGLFLSRFKFESCVCVKPKGGPRASSGLKRYLIGLSVGEAGTPVF